MREWEIYYGSWLRIHEIVRCEVDGPLGWAAEFATWRNWVLFSLDTVRTNVLAGVELYWSKKEIRWPHLLLLKSGNLPDYTYTGTQEVSLEAGRGCHHHPIISVVIPPINLCAAIHLCKRWACIWKSWGRPNVGK